MVYSKRKHIEILSRIVKRDLYKSDFIFAACCANNILIFPVVEILETEFWLFAGSGRSCRNTDRSMDRVVDLYIHTYVKFPLRLLFLASGSLPGIFRLAKNDQKAKAHKSCTYLLCTCLEYSRVNLRFLLLFCF